MDTPTPVTQEPVAPLQWSAYLHPEHERSHRWYIIGGLFVTLCILYGVFFYGGWSFALVMLLIAGMYFMLRRAPPAVGTIQLEDKGFTLSGQFTNYKDCTSFWFIKLPDYTELHIRKKRSVIPEAVIQTGPIAIPEIRAFLSQKLPEKEDQQERLIDRVIRLCKL